MSTEKLIANSYKGYYIVDAPFGVFKKSIDRNVLQKVDTVVGCARLDKLYLSVVQ
ncbi:hypothetical protein [Phosphitispora fastidiosa]|uniref:hypothetical protein n=1 Tax=Phosphitispora fastidiosa TaxID=2837202 RepID=UPI001E6233DF|nr:hypothetical protein [Phosphitispora fastidiosa]MBU7007847.1 hypothetical protein [Phosphitispora fastidiosa]